MPWARFLPSAEGVFARLAAFAVAAVLTLAAAPALAGRVEYTVAPGDTLLGIALEYDVRVADIRSWNNLRNDTIYVGQRLVIRTRGTSSERVRREYTIRSGDTGLAIARRVGVSWSDLQRWNRNTNFDRLRPGATLAYYVEEGGTGSRGAPNRGRLFEGTLLDAGNGYRIRNRERSWGTEFTVGAIRNGIARVQARFVDVPEVLVHDLSFERGGRMSPHVSHQNGRDVDITYYRTDCDELCDWRVVTPDQLDVERTWYLFRTWIQAGVVEYIFVDTSLQEPLYEFARARGATEAELDEWFEWPDGSSGIIRHSPGHDDHFHARFADPQ